MRRRSKLAIACSALLLSLTSGAFAAESADTEAKAIALLTGMQRVMHESAYQGTLVKTLLTAEGPVTHVMKIRHWLDAHGEHVGVVSLSGPEQIVSNDWQPMFDPSWNLENLTEAYAVSLVGHSRVAGQAVTLVDLKPHDHHRYSYRLAIDPDTQLLLQLSRRHGQGPWMEKMAFIEIDAMPDGGKPLESSTTGVATTDRAAVSKAAETQVSSAPWEVTWVPQAFAKRRTLKRSADPAQGESWHLVYGDGLTTVSVIVEPRQSPEQHLRGPLEARGLNAYGRVLGDDTQIIVLGELPADTVKRIASSVEPCAQGC